MNSQKTENLLNLALDSTEEERKKSLNLQVGYDPGERTWELIIRYDQSGDTLPAGAGASGASFIRLRNHPGAGVGD